jgi:hypothetical protein
MPIIKPKFDGKDEQSSQYSGPPPVPGPYHGVIKKMWFAKIKTGDNAGEDQYKILVEIDQGKYKGAGIFHNIQMLKQTAWNTNTFLDSMCENEAQSETLRKWFWQIGCDVEPDSDKVGQPVNYIGKPKFKPVGKGLSFIVKNEPGNDGVRAIIDRFIVKINGDEGETPVAEEDSSGLEEFEQASSSNPEPESTSEPETVAEAPPPEGDDDGDDPWS